MNMSNKPKPISAARHTDGLVFVSGQGGLNPETGAVVGDDLLSQTVQTVENIKRILAENELTLNDVLKANIYLSSRTLYDEFNHIYGLLFQPPYPSRTTVYCELNYDLLVEIDVIASKPGLS